MSATAQAAGSAATSAAAAIHGLKTQLVRLRDITVSGFTPSMYAADPGDQYTSRLLNTEGRLFKPLRVKAHADAIKQFSNSHPMGVQIGDRTRLHCDFTRYRTVDDQREISLKVGINVGFR